jgi:hypothetical protein
MSVTMDLRKKAFNKGVIMYTNFSLLTFKRIASQIQFPLNAAEYAQMEVSIRKTKDIKDHLYTALENGYYLDLFVSYNNGTYHSRITNILNMRIDYKSNTIGIHTQSINYVFDLEKVKFDATHSQDDIDVITTNHANTKQTTDDTYILKYRDVMKGYLISLKRRKVDKQLL